MIRIGAAGKAGRRDFTSLMSLPTGFAVANRDRLEQLNSSSNDGEWLTPCPAGSAIVSIDRTGPDGMVNVGDLLEVLNRRGGCDARPRILTGERPPPWWT